MAQVESSKQLSGIIIMVRMCMHIHSYLKDAFSFSMHRKIFILVKLQGLILPRYWLDLSATFLCGHNCNNIH